FILFTISSTSSFGGVIIAESKSDCCIVGTFSIDISLMADIQMQSYPILSNFASIGKNWIACI
ncbi:hypothetical protein, partial [Leyella stercorea]|uniref:hypothetical protein n=1 Tax=Leyella stercorea TaxID=363265 RepID=UPI00266C7AC8